MRKITRLEPGEEFIKYGRQCPNHKDKKAKVIMKGKIENGVKYTEHTKICTRTNEIIHQFIV